MKSAKQRTYTLGIDMPAQPSRVNRQPTLSAFTRNLLVVLIGTILVGCESYGTVYVGHPQVYTRERLVTARQKEVQFLNSELERPVEFTFQGARDTRLLN